MLIIKRTLSWFVERFSFLQKQELTKFVFVGGVGFCIDGGLLTLLMKLDWGVLPARSLSFMSAVTCTWLLNRNWTFDREEPVGVRKEYASYIATQIAGAGINLLVFFLLIGLYPAWRNTPLIPLAVGAAVSLIFNYTVSKKYVFKG